MFRLSNKIVQVNFTDKTEIILSSEQKLVTYVNLKGEKSEYALATALDSKNAEMGRVKQTLTGKKDEAGFFVIKFPAQTNIDTDSKIKIEQ